MPVIRSGIEIVTIQRARSVLMHGELLRDLVGVGMFIMDGVEASV